MQEPLKRFLKGRYQIFPPIPAANDYLYNRIFPEIVARKSEGRTDKIYGYCRAVPVRKLIQSLFISTIIYIKWGGGGGVEGGGGGEQASLK
jgi:hypothetical protein